MPATRESFANWFGGVKEAFTTADITDAWQVMNTDETMIVMEHLPKWTWSKNRTQVAVLGDVIKLL